MNIYFSGISGTGIGPLAEMAVGAGNTVFGSDVAAGVITESLLKKGVEVSIGEQDGGFLRKKYAAGGIDWLVYTSALPVDHPELLAARELGVKTTKRDEFINYMVHEHGLRMVAVAGTHGKTTTTAMIIWVCYRLGIPISYLVGSTLPWAEAGKYDDAAKFFVYEADEYDRNFLHFHPWLAVITSESYDHMDTYKTPEEYTAAFAKFRKQSEHVITEMDAFPADGLNLVGELRRRDAQLACSAVSMMALEMEGGSSRCSDIVAALNDFPGAGRRFEKISDGVYSDYGHHPEEVAATVTMARELKERKGYAGLAVVYEPHQNVRQHQVKDGYAKAFLGADKVFWLPTFLTREDPELVTLAPEDFIAGLTNREVAAPAEKDDGLARELRELRNENYLVLLMSAGPADGWLRKIFS